MDGKSQTIKEWSEMMFGGSTEQFDGQPSDLMMTRSSVLPPVCVGCVRACCMSNVLSSSARRLACRSAGSLACTLKSPVTAKCGDDFQQFRQLIKEPLGHGFTARAINDDVDNIQ